MIQNDFTIHIRRAESGDEACLTHVQTESWKAAFAGIVPAELLAQCTSIERAEKMYARLLAEQRGNGYILELDGKPHCVAWWDAAREEGMPGAAGKLAPRLRQPDDGARSRGRKGCRIHKAPALGVHGQRARDPVLRSAGLHLRRQKAARVRHNGGNVRPSAVKPHRGAAAIFRLAGCRTTGRCAAEMQEDGILKKSRAKHVLPWTGAARRHQQQRRRV